MTVEWFTPNPKPALEWFGLLSGTIASMGGGGTSAVASVIGPPGSGSSVGPGFKIVGAEIRFDISSLTGL